MFCSIFSLYSSASWQTSQIVEIAILMQKRYICKFDHIIFRSYSDTIAIGNTKILLAAQVAAVMNSNKYLQIFVHLEKS